MIRKIVAEFLGTAMLVIFGCGTAVTVGCDAASGSGYLLTALAFGLVVMALAYSIGDISGCHVNPAVTIGFMVSGRQDIMEGLCYIGAQFVGALAGAGVMAAIWGTNTGYGANALYQGSGLKSILIEAILTFIFVYVILRVTLYKKYSGVAGLIIGLTLTLVHILGIGLTGTSVNPARSFGPALLAGGDALRGLYAFIIGPVIGACLAAIASMFSLQRRQ